MKAAFHLLTRGVSPPLVRKWRRLTSPAREILYTSMLFSLFPLPLLQLDDKQDGERSVPDMAFDMFA